MTNSIIFLFKRELLFNINSVKNKAYFFSFLFFCPLVSLYAQAKIGLDSSKPLKYLVKVSDFYSLSPTANHYVHKKSRVSADIYNVSGNEGPVKNRQVVERESDRHSRRSIQLGEDFVMFYPALSSGKVGGRENLSENRERMSGSAERGKPIVMESDLLEDGRLLKVYLPESMKSKVLNGTLQGLFLGEKEPFSLSGDRGVKVESSDYNCRMKDMFLNCVIEYQAVVL